MLQYWKRSPRSPEQPRWAVSLYPCEFWGSALSWRPRFPNVMRKRRPDRSRSGGSQQPIHLLPVLVVQYLPSSSVIASPTGCCVPSCLSVHHTIARCCCSSQDPPNVSAAVITPVRIPRPNSTVVTPLSPTSPPTAALLAVAGILPAVMRCRGTQ